MLLLLYSNLLRTFCAIIYTTPKVLKHTVLVITPSYDLNHSPLILNGSVMDVVGIGRIEEEESRGERQRSYSTVGTVHVSLLGLRGARGFAHGRQERRFFPSNLFLD
jgi:hypothetical protein